ncbi:MAG: oligosaccharide flippase family protein [Syntrophorhabdaceae bacterium]|nr:oligosaccharide flippase family protein [Syntrophorhabdaceae bacterium]
MSIKKDDTESGPNLRYLDSLSKRYSFKLLANVFGFLIGIVMQMIIPRGLGPKAYGDFSFLTNFFSQLVGFLDMGTSTCFYINISSRPKEYPLVSFYSYFALLVTALVFGFVAFVHSAGIHDKIWLEQNIVYVYLAAGWGLLNWYVQILGGTTDAYGMTVPAEKARMLQRTISLVAIVLLYMCHQLKLLQFYIYHYAIFLFLLIIFIRIIHRNVLKLTVHQKLSREKAKAYAKDFFNYGHPIFIIAVVVLIEGIFDRWLLQYYGGSMQQGFYSLSYQIGGICLLFTSAMTPLLMREYSILHCNNNLQEMGRLFKRYVPMLYAIAAYFSCFIMVQAREVVRITGGSAFEGSIVAVSIMALYPIHQTYGQLTSSLFYAMGQTKLYRNISVVLSMCSLPFTYLMIAPVDKLGLNAGATGLAIKMLAINIIGVNIQLYFNVKLLGLKFGNYLAKQISCLIVFMGCAVLSSFCSDYLIPNSIGSFLLSGVFYTAMAGLIVFFKPETLGLGEEDIRYVIQQIRDRLNLNKE